MAGHYDFNVILMLDVFEHFKTQCPVFSESEAEIIHLMQSPRTYIKLHKSLPNISMYGGLRDTSWSVHTNKRSLKQANDVVEHNDSVLDMCRRWKTAFNSPKQFAPGIFRFCGNVEAFEEDLVAFRMMLARERIREW